MLLLILDESQKIRKLWLIEMELVFQSSHLNPTRSDLRGEKRQRCAMLHQH